MTPPRQILPNQVFDVCSRTLGRTFRLVPSVQVTELFYYLLGLLGPKHGIQFYAAVQMSSHYHLVGLDTLGRLPLFMQEFNSLLARALNALQGLEDKVWSGDGYGLVRPVGEQDVLGRIVYALSNPSAADLVHHAEDHAGAISRPSEIGITRTIERPAFFFRALKGKVPDRVTLRFDVPEAFAGLGRDGYVALLRSELSAVEQQHRATRKAAGRTVLGADRCRSVRHNQRSGAWERWFAVRPAIAARRVADRVAALDRLREFRDRYIAALARWREAARSAACAAVDGLAAPGSALLDVVFPAGTWWMRRFAGVVTD